VKASVAGPVSKSCATPTYRRSAPASASTWMVEPTAMDRAITRLTGLNVPVAVVSATARFTRMEPATTPGQTRGPHSRIAASAMPDGGQTAVA